jgi:choline dehydrogenase-like flavoprotein
VIKSAIKQLKIKIPVDGNAGTAVGGFFFTHNQDPVQQVRSSARTGYWNPVSNRKNFHLLVSHQVTRLLTRGLTTSSASQATVWGVEFAASSSSSRLTVNVTNQAIVSAGALHSPQILQLSGIGDPTLLSQYGIKSVVNLPGVGQNLHDHPYVAVVTVNNLTLSTNNLSDPTFAAQAMAEYKKYRTGPYSTGTGDFIAFLPVTNYTSASTAASLASQAQAQTPSQYLDPSTPSSVVTGYAAQKSSLTSAITDATGTAFLEVIFADGVFVLGLQHPFSRGSVKINSADPFTPATFDARFLTNPLDTAFLVDAVRFARTLYSTPAMQGIASFEVVPGTSAQSDADIEAYIRSSLGTLWHPAGTCKAGAQASGGVVDKNFKVYGVSNLRVVDASVFPTLPGMHTQWSVYALAEKAADIIKG